MPIRTFLPGRSFDPETLDILNKAFAAACADLNVRATARHSREMIAAQVLELSQGQRDPEVIRAAVVAALLAKK